MKITTLRLPEGLAEDLEEEAEDKDLSFSEYVRRILRARDRIRKKNTPDYDKRIRDLERRVDDLEGPAKRTTKDRETNEELVNWVQEHQPVSKADILENCVPESFPGKPESWWDRHGRQELQDAGGQYTRNIGWMID